MAELPEYSVKSQFIQVGVKREVNNYWTFSILALTNTRSAASQILLQTNGFRIGANRESGCLLTYRRSSSGYTGCSWFKVGFLLGKRRVIYTKGNPGKRPGFIQWYRAARDRILAIGKPTRTD